MDMTINQRLDDFLEEKHISQEELRSQLGLKTRQQVSNWINCREKISEKHIIRIVELYPELNANWLIANAGNMFNDQKIVRHINRNAYGFCEECIKKEQKIEYLQELIHQRDQEIKLLNREIGKLEDRLARCVENKEL